MVTYRTRPVEPVEVDARLVTDATAHEIAEWCDAIVYTGDRHGHTTPPWAMHTCITLFAPDQAAFTGYWVVRYPDGTFEVFSPDDFAVKFEKVE
jgi:hypothetical protein